jgi:predicted outer membrane repeat protein
MKRWTIISFILVLSQITSAATIHVPDDFTTIQVGILAASEGDTVLVADGTYTGTGNRDISFNGKNIVIMSENGPEVTIIDCQGTESVPHRAFIFNNNEGSTSIVEGLTMINGYGLDEYGMSKGGALFCYGTSPKFINCVFSNNACHGRGGAVAAWASSPIFDNCSFIDNSAFHGGGVYLSAGSFKNNTLNHEPMLINCTFSGNYALTDNGYGGGICARIWNMDVTVEGCVFFDNIAKYGGGISVGQSTNIYISNCTFAYNSADYGGSIDIYYAGTSEVHNSIISYSLNSLAFYKQNVNQLSITCCDMFGNFGGDWVGDMSLFLGKYGNISEDPLFCDASSSDFSIQGTSPCSPFMNPECSLIGALDIDCHGEIEYPIAAAINFGSSPNDHLIYQPTPEIFWSYIDTAATSQLQYEIEVGTDDDWTTAEMWSTGPVSSSDTSVIYTGLPLTRGETYYIRVRVNNGTIWGNWLENWFMLNPGFVVRVPDDVLTIQAGIDLTMSGDTVLIAPGTYTGDGNRDLDYGGRNIIVVSEGGPEVTILDCEGSQSEPHRAFNFISGENSSAILDGFTLTGGYGNFSDGYYVGGAIYLANTNPTIKNCIFDQNDAESGGAIYGDDASPVFADCEFTTNLASHLGGSLAIFSGEPTFNTCIFSNNGGGTKGGAIAGYDAITIMNECTFNNNSAEDGGAVHFEGFIGKRSATVSMDICVLNDNIALTNGGAVYFGVNTAASLHNCTLADNEAIIASGIYTQSSDYLIVENCIIAYGISGEAIYCGEPGIPDITCSDIYGNFGGDWVGCISSLAGINFNFSDDPMFCDRITDDYRLNFPSSPCYNGNTPCNELVGALTIGCGNYLCGDSNNDSAVNVSDAVWIIGYVFVGGDPPQPLESGDVNCDTFVNVSDAVWIINYVFIGGNAPCDPSGDGIPDC